MHPALLDRLRGSAKVLDISMNSAVLKACDDLSAILNKGWRPKARVAHDGTTYLMLRIAPEIKKGWDEAAKDAELTFSAFARLGSLATLLAIEHKTQVVWPLQFKRQDFVRAVSLANTDGWL